VRRDLRNWAARRQADLVLYLGAFLLSISALIFVSYTGSGGVVKSVLFGLYTLLFLVLGIQLLKWTRVQEAGPVFLASAPSSFRQFRRASPTPTSSATMTCPGVSGCRVSTAALYSLLAWRGFGALYWLPAGGAYFAAYASLGACLHFGPEWYGPWFVALAVAGVFAAHQLPLPGRIRGYVEAGSYALGFWRAIHPPGCRRRSPRGHPGRHSLRRLRSSARFSRRAAFDASARLSHGGRPAVDSWSQIVLNWFSLALLPWARWPSPG
jgi:hypothetical protein